MGADEIQAVKDRIVDTYWRRLCTVEGVESPKVDGIAEDIIDDSWEVIDIGIRATRYAADMTAEGWEDVDWVWVKETFFC